MGYLKSVAMFVYRFIVGDDWTVAAGVAVALAVTAAAGRAMPAWWIMPVAGVALLVWGVRGTTGPR